MKKNFLSICLIVILFLSSISYASVPSPKIQVANIKGIPTEFVPYDLSTRYPIITLQFNYLLTKGLGPNFHIDEALILTLDNNSYQLVTFYFPTQYPTSCSVMAIFLGRNIWVRTGVVEEDGSVTFDMTEISGTKVEMFVFSNL